MNLEKKLFGLIFRLYKSNFNLIILISNKW